jgi:hypothetical protein
MIQDESWKPCSFEDCRHCLGTGRVVRIVALKEALEKESSVELFERSS